MTMGLELVDNVMRVVRKYATDSMTIACIEKDLTEDWQDKLFSQWCFEDVRSLEREDEKFDDAFCASVLEYCRNKHDSEIGINWGTIRCAIDECKEDEVDDE